MRTIVAALLLVCGVAAAQAQRIEAVDILAAGIYEPGKLKTIEDPSISTGERHEAVATLKKRTTVIPARNNTSFGVTVMIYGRPHGKVVPVRIVWHYPEPGLHNPDTGITKRVDDYIERKALGEETKFYWVLGDDWVLVPGEWTIEIYDQDRLLASQSFTLVKDE